jgi:D-beta-D-heptose 7-phosphate kinase/D-beta-D-heptose 1-phosphate adenosyltransferase
MYYYDEHLGKLGGATVLCIGDLMLDDFVYGEVTRISPEAPAPVIAVTREQKLIGGAGNVARGIDALGAHCIFVSVMGEDEAGRVVARAFLEECPSVETHLMVDPARPTTRKVRFVSEHYSTHMLRADWELATPVSAAIEGAITSAALKVLPRADAVVLSDYAKGVLTPRVVRAVIDAARAANKPVVVDPKGQDYSLYRGATLITPNRKELAEATHRPIANESDLVAAAEDLARLVESEAVLVTRSEEGMTLYTPAAGVVHVPAYAVKIRDVSGAGDTVAAVLSVMLAAKAHFEPAMRAANAAAAVAVGKRGTAKVSVAELRSRLLSAAFLAPEEKIVFDWAVLDEHLADWRRQGLRVGFTNGCFDLLHPGHIKLLTEARAACDRLIVGLNTDDSVRRLKGANRPVQSQQARAEVLSALEAVDLVVLFGEDTPIELIRRVAPTILVKGADYRVDQVVGHELVEAHGGEVLLVGLAEGHSTTRLIGDGGKPSPKPPAPAKKPAQPKNAQKK